MDNRNFEFKSKHNFAYATHNRETDTYYSNEK